jgi:hypothetical protein
MEGGVAVCKEYCNEKEKPNRLQKQLLVPREVEERKLLSKFLENPLHRLSDPTHSSVKPLLHFG